MRGQTIRRANHRLTFLLIEGRYSPDGLEWQSQTNQQRAGIRFWLDTE
jgi:hypothetical protein